MSTLTISLSESQLAKIEAKARKKGAHIEEVVGQWLEEAIAQSEARDRKEAELVALLNEGLNSPKQEMTNQWWDDLLTEVDVNLEKQGKIGGVREAFTKLQVEENAE